MFVDVDQAAPLRAVRTLFAGYHGRYWIAGGWAVDLFLGRFRRPHTDVDVMVRAEDLDEFGRTFGDHAIRKLDHRTGAERPWSPGDPVEPGRDSLLFPGPVPVEAVVALSDGDDWVFHRGRNTRRRWDQLSRVSGSGLPFVAPEVVLLFKARDGRPKDDADFRDLLPALTAEQKAWLVPRLGPPGTTHPWLPALTSHG